MEKDCIILQQEKYQHYKEKQCRNSKVVFIVSIAFILLQQKSNGNLIKKVYRNKDCSKFVMSSEDTKIL